MHQFFSLPPPFLRHPFSPSCSAAVGLLPPSGSRPASSSVELMRICDGGARRICGSPPPDSRTSRAAPATSRARSCGGPCKQGRAALPLLRRAGVLPPPALPFRAGPPPLPPSPPSCSHSMTAAVARPSSLLLPRAPRRAVGTRADARALRHRGA